MKAVLFPGQGSQKVGMGKDLVEEFVMAREIYLQADETLGFSIANISMEGPEEALMKTENAQPAILAYNYIAFQLMKQKGFSCDYTAGHSLGEFSALVAAGMLKFEDALKVVRKRGQLMAAADPDGKGAMAAVMGLDDEAVIRVCAEVARTAYVEPVNFNCPGQVVISGLKEGIDAAEIKLKEAGAKRVVKLAVSGAFHSRLMEGAAEEFGKYLEDIEFRKANCPAISNVTASPIDEKEVRGLLTQQMKSPVQWTKSIRWMDSKGVKQYIEAGFGNVVQGLVKKILPEAEAIGWNQYING